MHLRLFLYQLAHTYHLSSGATRQLLDGADLGHEPAQAAAGWWPAVRLLAAGLGGFGLVLWVAANWDALGRWGQFALLQGGVLASGLLAWRAARWRVPMGLLCLLGIGALFAYFGQTYQTGADPWQLFALWAALALPLCLACKSDVLWLPWGLVASTGIGLWTATYTGYSSFGWRTQPNDWTFHLLAWTLLLLLALGLGPLCRRWTGAGLWSYRTVAFTGIASISTVAVYGLLEAQVAPQYPMGLLLLALVAWGLAQARWFDIFALSAVALGLDVLLACGLVRGLFSSSSGAFVFPLLLIGLAATGMLVATVNGILRLQRQHAKD